MPRTTRSGNVAPDYNFLIVSAYTDIRNAKQLRANRWFKSNYYNDLCIIYLFVFSLVKTVLFSGKLETYTRIGTKLPFPIQILCECSIILTYTDIRKLYIFNFNYLVLFTIWAD